MQKYLKSQEDDRPKVFAVSSVTEFVDLATWFDDAVIFRGQTTSEEWPLVPSVGRNVRKSDFFRRERQILDEFKRESIPYLDFLPQNDWQWLAVAQHNRLPTRLLDWTRNPLAALWFAVKDSAMGEQPGVVWVFYDKGTNAVHNTDGRKSPFMIDKTYTYFAEHVFAFIQAQSGVFTVHHKEETDSGKFVPLEQMKDSDILLSKIEIAFHAFDITCSDLASVQPRYSLGCRGLSTGSDMKTCSAKTKKRPNKAFNRSV